MEGSELLLRSNISKSNLPASAVMPESEPATEAWERTVLSLFHSTSAARNGHLSRKDSLHAHLYVEVASKRYRQKYLLRRHGQSKCWSLMRVFASFWMVTAVEQGYVERRPDEQNL
jgi:hypothetical protein